MLSVRVPRGTRSGRASRAGVLGNANEAPLTRPPPGTPNFPASAGSAKTARMPLPPFWLRSSPLPTLIAAGESVWYHSASRRTTPTGTPQVRAASSGVHARASVMNASKPSTCRSTNARSRPPRRSSSAATAHASTTSVPGRSATCRSACAATFVRFGSTTTSFAPRVRARLSTGIRCRFDHVTLLPQAITSRACSTCSGRMPGTGPNVPTHASVRMPPQRGLRSSRLAPSRWKKRRSIEPPASIPCGPA